MLDIRLIREHTDLVKATLAKAGVEPQLVDNVLIYDTQRRTLLQEVEQLKALRNSTSKEISTLKDATIRDAKIAEMRTVGDRISALDKQVADVEAAQQAAILELRNLPHDTVPVGPDEEHNVVLATYGTPRTFDFAVKPHWELGTSLDIIDFERGVKVTGSRFYILKGLGSRLQRALIQWLLDLHGKQGYTEVYTPFIVKELSLWGARQLPKFRDNLYHDAEEDYWLVPTAEVPVTNLHRDEILDATQLPIHYCAYTPCFRREKMSAGRDVRGIKRGHQFDKVEMYKFVHPDTSYAELEKLRADAEESCRLLGLTYRTKVLCTGDMGFASTKTYDIEVWAPGQSEWLEVSSCSNVESFQARATNIRFRSEAGAKTEFVHTLNGSGLGIPRTMIAIMENYQNADGSITVPDVLRPYLGGLDIIK
ncbi:MAG: hypothetical protein RL076_2753 [Chloroflexota bacterium]|jgi:seryl-tRNA synthetase